MTSKDTPENNCEHRVLDYNPKTQRLWHPPYCKLVLESCRYLGRKITISEYGKPRQVRLCELADKLKSKPGNDKPDKGLIGILKNMLTRKK